MGVYDRQVAQAQRAIAAKGQLCSWRQTPDVAPDSTKPWIRQNAAMTTYSVFIAFPPMASGLMRLMQGTNIPAGAVRGLMANPTNFTPQDNDTIQRGNQVYRISKLDPLAINEQIILWTLELRP